jgi:phospholipid:diacylglycerol acyltransferase
MASLRHRVPGGAKPTDKREDSPDKAEVRLAPDTKIVTTKQRGNKRRNGLIFFLGGLVGLLAAGFLAQRNDLLDLPELGDISMDNLIDVLPAGFVSDARDLMVRTLNS